MANKDKLIASAQKFLAKGQIPKAIHEYRKLVNAFPRDVRNRQKLAELLSRDRRSEEALNEYASVAAHYTDTGFYLKAIAVYKQMQKLDPSRIDLCHRLAELNVKQGLIGNALTEYRNLVAYYDKNAMYQEAIEVLEKMAELDPDNLNIVAKTAECYVALDRTDDALEKIQDIVAPLAARGEHIKVIKLYDRFLDICPDEGPSRLPLAKALIGNGAPDKAIQILKPLLKHAPEDPEINRCLAEAYVADKDFDNARLTLKHLLKQDETDLDLCTAYIRVCFDANDPEQAQHQLDKWQNAFFEQDRLSLLHELYGQLQQCLPEDDAVAETLAAIADIINEAAEPDQSEPLEAAADDATPDDPATNDTPVDVVDPERRTVDKT
ncbi:MAG: tetratricopeptide repeat protein, partial [Desulfuromonadales bacterium]